MCVGGATATARRSDAEEETAEAAAAADFTDTVHEEKARGSRRGTVEVKEDKRQPEEDEKLPTVADIGEGRSGGSSTAQCGVGDARCAAAAVESVEAEDAGRGYDYAEGSSTMFCVGDFRRTEAVCGLPLFGGSVTSAITVW